MQLKERPRPSVPISDYERRMTSDIMSPPPVFDIGKAVVSRRAVESMDVDGFSQFPALKLALMLSAYNLLVSETASGQELGSFLGRFSRLIEEEKDASDPLNLLPTIGFEVEVGIRGFRMMKSIQGWVKSFGYREILQKKFGINNYNSYLPNVDNNTGMVELAPSPSYTSEVQSRILSELIKGGFILSLAKSKDPENIRAFLSETLVSLHVNLGIPRGAKINECPKTYEDINLFASMFAFAFSSPLRLEHKNSPHLLSVKDKNVTRTKKSGRNGRLEVKCLEVRDESVYRLLREIQLIGSSLFMAYADETSVLGDEWREISDLIYELYEKKGVNGKILGDQSSIAEFSAKVTLDREDLETLGIEDHKDEDSLIGRQGMLPWALRIFITRRARRIRRIIEQQRDGHLL